MAEEQVDFNADASDLIEELARVNKVFQQYRKNLDKMTVHSLKFNDAGEIMGATVSGITKEGHKLSQTLKNLRDDEGNLTDIIEASTTALKLNNDKLKEQIQLQNAKNSAMSRQINRDFESDISDRKETFDSLRNAIKERAASELAEEKMLSDAKERQALRLTKNLTQEEKTRRSNIIRAIKERAADELAEEKMLSDAKERQAKNLTKEMAQEEKIRRSNIIRAIKERASAELAQEKMLADAKERQAQRLTKEMAQEEKTRRSNLIRAIKERAAIEDRAARERLQKQQEVDKALATHQASRKIDEKITGTRVLMSKGAQTSTDVNARQQLIAAESALKSFLLKNRNTINDVAGMWNRVASGSIQKYGNELDGLQIRLLALKKAHNNLEKSSQPIHKKNVQGIENTNKSLDSQRKRLQLLLLSWQSIGRLAAVSIIHRAVSGLTEAVRASVEEVVNLRIALAEIETIGPRFTSLEITDTVRDLSDQFGIPIVEQAEAAYETLSNQVAQTDQQLRIFLETSNKFALATKSSAEDSVNLLTSALNAYGKNVEDVDTVAAQFFTAIDLGRFRAEDLADSFGQVAIVASQMDISLEEVLASLTTMSRQGVKADESMTFLRNIILKLIRPTDEMKENFKRMGVESGQAAIQTYGFQGFLQLLEEQTRGSSKELGELFGRIRAISGAMSVTGKNLSVFNSDLKEITESTKAYDNAVQITTNNLGRNFVRESNRIKNFFIKDVTEDIIESVSDVTNEFKSILPVIKEVVNFIKSSLIPVTVLLTGHILKVGYAFALANPAIGALAAGLVALTYVHSKVIESSKEAKRAFDREIDAVKELVRERTKEANQLSNQYVNTIKSALELRTKIVLKQLTAERKAIQEILVEVSGDFKTLQESMEETTEDSIKTLDKLASESEDKLNRIRAAIQGNANAIKSLDLEIKRQEISVNLTGLTDTNQLSELDEQLRKYRGLRSDVEDLDAFDDITNIIGFIQSERESIISQLKREGILEEDSINIAQEKLDLLREEKALREELGKQQQRLLTESQKVHLEQLVFIDQMRAAFRDLNDFKISNVLKIEDPEIFKQSIQEQLAAIDLLLKNAKELELTPEREDDLRTQRQRLVDVSEAQIKDIILKDTQEETQRLLEEQTAILQQSLDAIKADRELKDELAKLLINASALFKPLAGSKDDPLIILDELQTRAGREGLRKKFPNLPQNNSFAGSGDLLDLIRDPSKISDVITDPDQFKKIMEIMSRVSKDIEAFGDLSIDQINTISGFDNLGESIRALDAINKALTALAKNDPIESAEVLNERQKQVDRLNEALKTISESIESVVDEDQVDKLQNLAEQIEMIESKLQNLNNISIEPTPEAPGENAGGSAEININIAASGNVETDVMAIGRALEREVLRGNINLGVRV